MSFKTKSVICKVTLFNFRLTSEVITLGYFQMPMPLRYRFLACYRISAFRFWEWHAVGEDNDACRCLLMWHNGIHRPRFVAAVTANLRICNHFGVGDGAERRRDGGLQVRKRKRARERERRERTEGDGRFIGTVVALFVRGALIEKIRTFLRVRKTIKEKYSQSHTIWPNRMF